MFILSLTGICQFHCKYVENVNIEGTAVASVSNTAVSELRLYYIQTSCSDQTLSPDWKRPG